MSFLNDLRTLLIDARIALRNLPDFDEDPLWDRMEKAIRDISKFVMPPPTANTKTTAQQVALAWQTVSRGLKLTQPKLYDELAAKVMILLDEKELVEPVTELLQLEEQVKKLEAQLKPMQQRLNDLGKKAGEAQSRLEALHQALAAAAPQVQTSPDPQLLALQRVTALTTQPRAATGGASASASASAYAVASSAAAESHIPGRGVLEAVAASQRAFTREQREWSVAECLALTGWQFTPLELIEKGDPWMAQQILAAPNAPH